MGFQIIELSNEGMILALELQITGNGFQSSDMEPCMARLNLYLKRMEKEKRYLVIRSGDWARIRVVEQNVKTIYGAYQGFYSHPRLLAIGAFSSQEMPVVSFFANLLAQINRKQIGIFPSAKEADEFLKASMSEVKGL